jgi:uncharacterized protein involved in outer membrane biogenesis
MKIQRKWLIVAGVVLLVLILASVGFHLFSQDFARRHAKAYLSKRFQSDVQFSSLRVSLLPFVHIECEDVVLRHHNRTDVPPLITLKKITLDGNLLGMLLFRPHLNKAHIDGLRIIVPPREPKHDGAEQSEEKVKPAKHSAFTVDTVTTDDAQLDLLRKESKKPTLTFAIHQLTMHSVNLDNSAPFHATLTNPKPIGEIHSDGDFGPWNAEEPSLTPVRGTFTFSQADLNTIKGISGILSSEGKYDGVLEHINVQGATTTPDFSIDISGHPVSLTTQYDAYVDGTNGNTVLNSVNAQFLHTSLVAKGAILKMQDEEGREVKLDVVLDNGKLGDLLTLALKGEPPMTGDTKLQTKFDLPPGKETVIKRLNLDGQFNIENGRFTQADIQNKVDSLSNRGQGQPQEKDAGTAVSHLRGKFTLRNGVAKFSTLMFDVEGASVQLAGQYNLVDESLDFKGVLRLQARLSQTTTGIKSFFLKAIDPWFAGKKAGTVLPIKITGTRTNPSFGLQVGAALTRKNIPQTKNPPKP